MEKKLKKLFDYQKFEGNERLAKLEEEAEETRELSDEELEGVSAAYYVHSTEQRRPLPEDIVREKR